MQGAGRDIDNEAADENLVACFEGDDNDNEEIGMPVNVSEGELRQVFSQLGGVIGSLLRLSITTSNHAPQDNFEFGADAEVGYFEPWDIQRVRAKFPQFDDQIAERLGQALTHRRMYFKYRERHDR